MSPHDADTPAQRTPIQPPRRLDKLVASACLTQGEADRLQAASDSAQRDEVLTGIRVRHAAARLDAVVEAGRLSREEAERILERLRAGDHSPVLRAQLRRLEQPGFSRDEQAQQ